MKKFDRSSWMKWSVLILALFVVLPINADLVCHDGEKPSEETNFKHDYYCDDGRDEYKVGNRLICCYLTAAYQCKQTGMIARFLLEDAATGYSKLPPLAVTKEEALWKDFVYESRANGRDFLCPYPFGYLWFDQVPTPSGYLPRRFLPTDYEDQTTILKPCNRNEDCASDEFCGDVINGSFDAKYSRLKNDPSQFCTLNTAGSNCDLSPTDQPYVDKHKHFCYKVPDMVSAPSDTVQYWIESTRRNLKLCDRDDQCGTGRKCHLSKTHRWWAYNRETDKRESYQGICIESMPISYTFYKIYDSLSAVSKQESVGRQYLPVHSENKKRSELQTCNKNWDCLADEFCGHVYSVNDFANMDSNFKYCYKVPEDLPNAFVEPDGVDLMVCDTNEDCDGRSCDTSHVKSYLSNVNSQLKFATGICLKPQVEEVEEDSSLIIIIVILVALIVVIFATLIGGFVLFKLKKKPNNCATETTSGGKKNKKAKKEKKNKKGKKPSGKTSTTTKSLSVTGKSGMGTTTGGYSPAIF